MRFNRTTMRAGLFAGLGTSLWTLFEYVMGWHGPNIEVGAVTGFVGVLFPLVAIIWALHRTRAELGGRLTLGQALAVGLSVSLILSAIGLVFYQLYYTVINPGFIARLQATGTPTDTVTQLATVVVGSIGFSLVIALVGGLVLRTRGGAHDA